MAEAYFLLLWRVMRSQRHPKGDCKEVFLSFACLNIEAARRAIGLSLWRPDLPHSDLGAIGVPVQFLPSELWVLGLGHLGNAYLWALAALPYANPTAAEIYLGNNR